MDLNHWLALFLILVGIALIFYGIYGFKLAKERQKLWKELAKIFKELAEKLKETEKENIKKAHFRTPKVKKIEPPESEKPKDKICEICGKLVKARGYGGHLFLKHGIKGTKTNKGGN